MGESRRKEKVTASILVAGSLVYSFGCLHLKAGTLASPGAGLIPRLIGALLILFTSLHCWRTFRSKGGSPEAGEKTKGARINYLASLGMAACVVAYPFLLRNLKFLLATFIVVFAMLVLLRYRGVVVSFLVSLAVTVASFLVFSRLLGVVLPGGILEQFLLSLG